MVKVPPCSDKSCIQTSNIIRMEWKVDLLIEKVDEIKTNLKEDYATKQELQNTELKISNHTEKIDKIQDIINKLAWIIVWTVITAAIALIIK